MSLLVVVENSLAIIRIGRQLVCLSLFILFFILKFLLIGY